MEFNLAGYVQLGKCWGKAKGPHLLKVLLI